MWDEARYPTMSPLREIVDAIHLQVSKIEDDLKVLFPFPLLPILFYIFYSIAIVNVYVSHENVRCM